MSAQSRTETNSYKVMKTTDTMHITELQEKEVVSLHLILITRYK